MPKIIENIREKLLEEAKRQITENGYSAMTIRSVAKACGVGVGTVYNYFPSKDMLIASFVLEDWMQTIASINKGMSEAADAKEALHCMYDELLAFCEKNSALFSDKDAGESFGASYMNRHNLLCDQLAAPLRIWTEKQTKVDAEFLAKFVAESMLTWTKSDIKFEQIADILLQLL